MALRIIALATMLSLGLGIGGIVERQYQSNRPQFAYIDGCVDGVVDGLKVGGVPFDEGYRHALEVYCQIKFEQRGIK